MEAVELQMKGSFYFSPVDPRIRHRAQRKATTVLHGLQFLGATASVSVGSVTILEFPLILDDHPILNLCHLVILQQLAGLIKADLR